MFSFFRTLCRSKPAAPALREVKLRGVDPKNCISAQTELNESSSPAIYRSILPNGLMLVSHLSSQHQPSCELKTEDGASLFSHT